MLKVCRTSAHHGYINHENNLMQTLDLLHRNPTIDIVEVDFVYHNKNYISSHDYSDDNINNGSSLEEWVEHLIKLKKVLWIDLKDTTTSVVFPSLSKLNVNKLILKLNNLSLFYPMLNKFIIISCQYNKIYNKLKMFNNHFTIMKDCPKDYYYLLNYFTTSFNDSIIDNIDNKVIAIDKNFIDDIDNFIDQVPSTIIILYNYELDDIVPTSNKKHLIYQYNYKK